MVVRPWSALSGLIQARGAWEAGDGRVTKSLTAAGPRFSPPWRILDRPAVDLLNSGWICQHVLGEAHRQVVIRRDTGLDLSTFSTDPTPVLARKACQTPVPRAPPPRDENRHT